jgi:hypothetical protein
MAQARFTNTSPIINGIATVGNASRVPQTYDPYPSGLEHMPSGDSMLFYQNLNKRFIYHGGANGSGSWEH